MQFYTGQHRYYRGIDLHARQMYVCIVNQEGAILVHRNIKTDPTCFLELIAPYRDDLAVAVECITCRRWPSGRARNRSAPPFRLTSPIRWCGQ